jgi:mono/diheme cytochrome c family protein
MFETTGPMRRGTMAAAIAVLAVLGAAHAQAEDHFANADDAALVSKGRIAYSQYCGSCHGRNLQGQALWQLQDQFVGRRAPAHDATGHTWQHSDENLFRMVKFGRFPDAPKSAVSYMPAFADSLSDAEILAVLAFIKSRWPIGLRASQASLNPGFAGMPADIGTTPWTLPPNCTASFQNWSEGSR